MRRVLRICGIVALSLALLPTLMWADNIIFTGTFSGTSGNGNALAASAEFKWLSGTNQLQVTFANTSAGDASSPIDVLTAVFWNMTGGATLTPVSALLYDSQVVNCTNQTGPFACTMPTGGNVGGEFAYAAGGAGHDYGIGNAGLGIFGSGNFNGPNLQDPNSVDGLNFGLAPGGTINYSNGDIDHSALIVGDPSGGGAVVLLLNSDTNLSDATISDVFFNYGTSLQTPPPPPPPPIPEPASLVLVGSGLALAAKAMRRKK